MRLLYGLEGSSALKQHRQSALCRNCCETCFGEKQNIFTNKRLRMLVVDIIGCTDVVSTMTYTVNIAGSLIVGIRPAKSKAPAAGPDRHWSDKNGNAQQERSRDLNLMRTIRNPCLFLTFRGKAFELVGNLPCNWPRNNMQVGGHSVFLPRK